MSTEEQFHVLQNGTMVLHFAVAADGTKSIQLSPINDASFKDPDNSLIMFTTEDLADIYKDKLCHAAAAQEFPKLIKGETFNPLTLEQCCDLQAHPFHQALEIA